MWKNIFPADLFLKYLLCFQWTNKSHSVLYIQPDKAMDPITWESCSPYVSSTKLHKRELCWHSMVSVRQGHSCSWQHICDTSWSHSSQSGDVFSYSVYWIFTCQSTPLLSSLIHMAPELPISVTLNSSWAEVRLLALGIPSVYTWCHK